MVPRLRPAISILVALALLTSGRLCVERPLDIRTDAPRASSGCEHPGCTDEPQVPQDREGPQGPSVCCSTWALEISRITLLNPSRVAEADFVSGPAPAVSHRLSGEHAQDVHPSWAFPPGESSPQLLLLATSLSGRAPPVLI